MIEKLDEIISFINSKSDWNKIEKIRYAYVALGKLVQKDVRFFYTIYGMLKNNDSGIKYNIEEIDKIMNRDPVEFTNNVICRTSAKMLGYIFDGIGIEYETRLATRATKYKDAGKTTEIRHVYLVATADDNKKYFLTLNPDIANIQIGKRSTEFGVRQPYRDEKGNQIYSGEEIIHSSLNRDELRAIDEKIGYDFINMDTGPKYADYLFSFLKYMYKYDKKTFTRGDYLNNLGNNTEFYYDLCQIINGDKSFEEVMISDDQYDERDLKDSCIDVNMSLCSDDTVNNVKLFVLYSVLSELYARLELEFTAESFRTFCSFVMNKDYEELKKHFIDEVGSNLSPEVYGILFHYKNMIKLFEKLDGREFLDIDDKERIAAYHNEISNCINDVCVLFIERDMLPSINGSLNSSYVTNLIIHSFNKIFDTGRVRDFNKFGLGEQVTIVREILNLVLNDERILYENDSRIKYERNKTAVDNRVFQTVVFDKEEGLEHPYYLMWVRPTKNEGEVGVSPILFDLKENKIYTDKSPVDIHDNYIIAKSKAFDEMLTSYSIGSDDWGIKI